MQFKRKSLATFGAAVLAAAVVAPGTSGPASAESVQPGYVEDTLVCLKLFFDDPAAHAAQCAGTPSGTTDSLYPGRSGTGNDDCEPGHGGENNGEASASDPCVKEDIQFLQQAGGLNFYRFKYVGDDHFYYGVNARELLDSPRFASAVSLQATGYYAVDYGALGLIVPEADEMKAAGRRAMDIVSASYPS